MNSRLFLIFCNMLWCLNYMTEVQCAQKALIFNRRDKQLVEKDPTDYYAECVRCITACPASSDSPQENIINDNASISRNGVFLRGVYGINQPYTHTKDMNTDLCDKPLIPATVWNDTMKSFEIGYELFYQEGWLNLECWDYEKYSKLRVIRGWPVENTNLPPNNAQIRSYNNNGSFKFEIINEDSTTIWVFYWIEVLSISVLSEGDHRFISFKKDTINDYFHGAESGRISIKKCLSYYTGGDGQILGDLDPQTSDQQYNNMSLVRTRIIPMRMFHSLSARLATCTHLNIAFIWEPIANEQLKKVDLYLYAIYRTWPSNIHISFGVDGELKRISSQIRDALYQSENNLLTKFPIPQIIYRVVEYHWENEIFDVVIVIHNELTAAIPLEDRICPIELSGWNEITNAGVETPGLTYACILTPEVLGKLHLNARPLNENPLDLHNFPVFKDLLGSIMYEDESGKVQEKLRHIKNLRIVD